LEGGKIDVKRSLEKPKLVVDVVVMGVAWSTSRMESR
jgi:hypothetical protein